MSSGRRLRALATPFVHFNVTILNREAIVYWSCVLTRHQRLCKFSKLPQRQEKTCLLVRTGGLEPPPPYGEQIFVPLRLSPPPCRRSWSGLSLRHSPSALGAARLVSTPSP